MVSLFNYLINIYIVLFTGLFAMLRWLIRPIIVDGSLKFFWFALMLQLQWHIWHIIRKPSFGRPCVDMHYEDATCQACMMPLQIVKLPFYPPLNWLSSSIFLPTNSVLWEFSDPPYATGRQSSAILGLPMDSLSCRLSIMMGLTIHRQVVGWEFLPKVTITTMAVIVRRCHIPPLGPPLLLFWPLAWPLCHSGAIADRRRVEVFPPPLFGANSGWSAT